MRRIEPLQGRGLSGSALDALGYRSGAVSFEDAGEYMSLLSRRPFTSPQSICSATESKEVLCMPFRRTENETVRVQSNTPSVRTADLSRLSLSSLLRRLVRVANAPTPRLRHKINRQDAHLIRLIIARKRHAPTRNTPMPDQVAQPLLDDISRYAQSRHPALHEQTHRPRAARVRNTRYLLAGRPGDEVADGAAGAIRARGAVDDGLPESGDRVEALTAD